MLYRDVFLKPHLLLSCCSTPPDQIPHICCKRHPRQQGFRYGVDYPKPMIQPVSRLPVGVRWRSFSDDSLLGESGVWKSLGHILNPNAFGICSTFWVQRACITPPSYEDWFSQNHGPKFMLLPPKYPKVGLSETLGKAIIPLDFAIILDQFPII